MNIGTIIQWGSNTIPNDWLLCDGRAVSRTTYADLFAVIGTNFGVGDGSTTFNLPDLRGKVAVGKSDDSEFDTLGETGGEKTHYHRTSMGFDGNGYIYGWLDENEMPGYDSYLFNSVTRIVTQGNKETGPVRLANTDNSSNLQPYIVTNYIIKALKPSEIKVSELPSATLFEDSDYTMIVQSGKNKKIAKADMLPFGKLLWEGEFTSGTITVSNLSKYTAIAVNVGGVLCFGNKYYGGCSFGAYGSYNISSYAYRLSNLGDNLTIDENNKGGTDGTYQATILAIYGLF